MSNFFRLNIIFVPSKELSDFAVNLAEGFNHKDEVFRVNNTNCLPHISTYYAPEFPEENLPKVSKALKDIATDLKPIELIPEKISEFFGYIGIWFKKTPEIIKVHEEILNALNPLRDGHISKEYLEEIEANKYPSTEIEYIKKYGGHLVLNAFNPHLTLGYFKTSQKIPDVKIPTTFANSLAICPVGPKGTCPKINEIFTS